MNNKKWFKNWTALDWLIAVILVVCFTMIAFYSCYFWGKPSTDPKDWGIFGDYFAAVFGLIAFLGVLYTASLSEKRAIKAEKESEKREERDQFFSMLKLYQQKADSIEIGELNGALAFKNIGEKANSYLIAYATLKKIISFDKSQFNVEEFKGVLEYLRTKGVHQDCYGSNVPNYSPESGDDIKYYFKYCNEVIDEGNIYELCLMSANCSKYFEYIKRNISIKDQYDAMNYVGKLIYKEYGFLLEPYFRNIYHTLEIVSYFTEDVKYTDIFRSQLSRYELLILLYYAVSGKTGMRDLNLLDNYKIFHYMIADDLLFIDESDKSRLNISSKVYEILMEYKKNIKKYYLDDMDLSLFHPE